MVVLLGEAILVFAKVEIGDGRMFSKVARGPQCAEGFLFCPVWTPGPHPHKVGQGWVPGGSVPTF